MAGTSLPLGYTWVTTVVGERGTLRRLTTATMGLAPVTSAPAAESAFGSNTTSYSRPSSNGTRATNVEKARVPSVASAEAALEAWHATTAAELDESLRAGDCARVREKWHMFLVTAKSRTNESGLGERRAAIVAKCPELEGVLR